MYHLSDECSNEIYWTAQLHRVGDQQPEREADSTVRSLSLLSSSWKKSRLQEGRPGVGVKPLCWWTNTLSERSWWYSWLPTGLHLLWQAEERASRIPSCSAPKQSSLHPGSDLEGQPSGEIKSAERNEAILMNCDWGKHMLSISLTLPGSLKLQSILANA